MKHLVVTLAFAALLAGALSSQEVRPDADRARSVDATASRARFDRIVTGLESVRRPTTEEYLELKRLLVESPELMDGLPGILRRGEVGPEASATVIYALEDIGSADTQKTLVSIHGDRAQRHEDQLRAAVSLGSVMAPTDATLASLRTAIERRSDPRSLDVARTSLLSLGRAGFRMRETGAPGWEGVRDELLQRLRTTPYRSERAVTLKALGNLRDGALGGEISNYLVDEAAPVRASAAQALGMLGDSVHRELVVALLPDEPFGAVRTAMVEALRELPADRASLGAVHAMLRAEPHAASRAQMVRYLVEHLREFDEPVETLRLMTTTDPSNEVRLLASAVLAL